MILLIAGARPNFMKIAPLSWELKRLNLEYKVLTTGQHYSPEMSSNIITELNIDNLISFDININLKHFEKFGRIIQNIYDYINENNPKLIIVVGDVDSTLAGTLAGIRKGIPIAHVESGLRSGDLSMPEEVNRMIVDKFSSYLFCTEESGMINLEKERIAGKKYLVGNVVIDTLQKILEKTPSEKYKNIISGLDNFCLLTLHRPSNVDEKHNLLHLLKIIRKSTDLPILFLIHPRTKKILQDEKIDDFIFCDPVSYTDMIHLINKCKLVFTDSGGIQDETSYLGIPCVTLRDNTERLITLKYTNILVGKLPTVEYLKSIVDNKIFEKNEPQSIKYWDGGASKRILTIIKKECKCLD